MKDKKKKAASVGGQGSRNPRHPRAGGKRGKTAAERAQYAVAVVTDDAGRWRQVRRVVDTVELLHRRRQIDGRQRQAAETYRDAVDACRSGVRSALASDGVRHAGTPAGPAEHQMWGAQVLADAARVLGLTDGRLVYAIVGEGRGIEEVAKIVFGAGANGKAREGDAKHVGRRLREALTALADAWWPMRPARILGLGVPPADMQAPQAGATERGRVVHATARRVYEW